jgi:hypothetical protein
LLSTVRSFAASRSGHRVAIHLYSLRDASLINF